MEIQILLNIYVKALENRMDSKGWNNTKVSEATGISPAMIGRYFKDDPDKRSAMPLESFLKIASVLGYDETLKKIETLKDIHNIEVTFQVVHNKTAGTQIPVMYGVFLTDGKVVASGRVRANTGIIYVGQNEKDSLPLDVFSEAMRKGVGIKNQIKIMDVRENEDQVELSKLSYENSPKQE
ncbi:hypothetical protein LCGC14_1191630 [marine sediment metagenome]|uniref:XRE family transcriptional regulator n=2 Tax=root TaxID=1 RepID=A0A831QT25_9FLAO|nr:XRE family transcriptional regulator [Pricia sp.]HEA22765.1 XRE family transcriptional regulator [Pricia antarctica]